MEKRLGRRGGSLCGKRGSACNSIGHGAAGRKAGRCVIRGSGGDADRARRPAPSIVPAGRRRAGPGPRRRRQHGDRVCRSASGALFAVASISLLQKKCLTPARPRSIVTISIDGRSEPGEPKEIHRPKTTREPHGAQLQGAPSFNVRAPHEAILAAADVGWFAGPFGPVSTFAVAGAFERRKRGRRGATKSATPQGVPPSASRGPFCGDPRGDRLWLVRDAIRTCSIANPRRGLRQPRERGRLGVK
jgi:hypothetical protein